MYNSQIIEYQINTNKEHNQTNMERTKHLWKIFRIPHVILHYIKQQMPK